MQIRKMEKSDTSIDQQKNMKKKRLIFWVTDSIHLELTRDIIKMAQVLERKSGCIETIS